MKKKIWYTGNNVQFFDSEPQGQSGNVGHFTIDTERGEVAGLNVQQSSEQRQSQPTSA